MKALWFLLCASLFITSCASLPEIHLADGPVALEVQAGCGAVFPDGNWQFVHSIEAEFPGGRKGFVMGAVVISSNPQKIECAIMSMEGFVLFDARQDQGLVINRAVHPFDKEEFAEGLLRDLRLIFFQPVGILIKSGRLKSGSSICRFQIPDGSVVDVIISPDNTWEIRQYGKDLRLTRTVQANALRNAGSPDKWPVPGKLKLTAHGSHGYALSMTLVDAVSLTQ
jgi:hypothetical protein